MLFYHVNGFYWPSKGSGKRLRVREKSVKSQGILIWIMSGNPANCEKANHTSDPACLCFHFISPPKDITKLNLSKDFNFSISQTKYNLKVSYLMADER